MFRRLIVGLLVGAVALGLAGPFGLGGLPGLAGEAPAHAQASGGQQITGTVFNQFADDKGNKVRQPVPDVRITVATPAGAAIGEARTDAKGQFTIPVPEGGQYVVAIDQSTLPAGVTVTDSTNTPRQIQVNPGGTQFTNFFLGKDLRHTRSRWHLFPQSVFNGLKLAAIIAICAIGLSLIYGTTGLSNFAHGEIVTMGAIMAWVANQRWGWHIFLALLVGVAASAAFGGLLETGLWRPMRDRSASLTSMMIVSIGLALGFRYVFQFFFGARARPYRQFAVQKEWKLGPITATPRTLSIMATCVVVIVAVCVFLLYTRFGKAIRAVADNPALASTTGINTDRVILIVWLLGGGLAGLGGVLFGLEVRVQWDMGFTLLLLMFAAITLGGLGNPFGALVGSLVIGLFVELWSFVFPSLDELKQVGALAALIALLLVRPQGILGRKERIG